MQLLQEVNDFAGQRELVAESLGIRVCLELAKYSQEMKQERKMVSPLPPMLAKGSVGTSLRVSICLHSISRKAVGLSSSWKMASNSWRL